MKGLRAGWAAFNEAGATLAALALLAGHPAAAQDLPPPVQAQIDDARADCESFEAGEFSMTPDAVQQRDLTGNGTPDWVVDESHMECSSAASMYCGSGGCGLSLIVGDHVAETLARGWAVVDAFGRTAVLLDVHGALCGGIGPTPCVEALTWDPDRQQKPIQEPGARSAGSIEQRLLCSG